MFLDKKRNNDIAIIELYVDPEMTCNMSPMDKNRNHHNFCNVRKNCHSSAVPDTSDISKQILISNSITPLQPQTKPNDKNMSKEQNKYSYQKA